MELFKVFKFSAQNKVVLLGYDLGGAIALSSCLNSKLSKAIKGVIALHPTWTESI